jgi:molybdopterin-guanine dinucleotide biosynthesis protein A
VSDRRGGIAAAIVAGGASSRFGGAPKGLERVGGRRILDRLADAANAVAGHLVLISNSDDADRWLPGVPVVRDIRPEQRSLVGIHTALSVAQRPTLVLAWDMPFVTRELLELIVEYGEREQFAVVPESTSGLEPFCALYAPACLRIVAQALDESDFRATALPHRFPSFTRVSTTEVRRFGDPDHLFFNVNSSADLARAEEIDREQRSRGQ